MFFVFNGKVNFMEKDNYLFKIGNKDIVCCMVECQEILMFCGKEDSYVNLYDDIVKCINDVFDVYYWIGDVEIFDLVVGLKIIWEIVQLVIEEFEKKLWVQC